MNPSALVILHEDFEEMEAVAPIDILRRAGVNVTVASRETDLTVTGRNGITLLADCGLFEAIQQHYDAIVLPGGPGTKNLREDPRVLDIIKKHHELGYLIAAICAAPLVLKDAGLLEGRQFTAHPSTAEELPDALATEAVVKDGKLLTSRGAGTATAFALAIASELTNAETATAVFEAICMTQAQ